MSLRRGSFRGRERWMTGGRRASDAAPQAQLPEAPPRPFGPTVDSIDIKAVLIEEDRPEIEAVKYVASYNWLNAKSPTILVPGSPPAWTPPAVDPQLKEDSGDFFRDINGAHYPSYPTEPALRSVLALQPDFDLPSLDVVGCGSTIGSLLRFAGSKSGSFRFDVDVIGDTVFLVRRENSPTELKKDVRGYGHTFPEAYTTWEAEARGSVSHQRIIQYEFGGLRFLVRSETDGYNRDSNSTVTQAPPTDQSSLDQVLTTMVMAHHTPAPGQGLELRSQGRVVPQEQIFDIKTRGQRNIFDMEEILPRLWVNQTEKFLLAYHRFGKFDHPQIQNVRQLVLNWQKDNAALLGRFHAIVKRIVDVVRDSEAQQVEVSWDGRGPLLITKQIGEGRRALPLELHQHWE